jgi:signal transduction histidine kinase
MTREREKKNCILSASREIDDRGHSYLQGIIHDFTYLKKAEKINLQIEKLAATGRLIRTLAHEVRNPLNNINLSVEQLLQEDDKEMIPVYLEIVHRNSDRIGDLITELLNSSRPTELQFERTSLQGVLDEAITGALDRITIQRVNMKIRYSDEPALISADKKKLRIAFLNIIVNALEAMENRRGELDISVENDSAEHRVIIKDTGIGIPEENISRLFEPYFTSKRNGMGLGLASTLNILQSHKANIDVQSILNEGTVFTISFQALK